MKRLSYIVALPLMLVFTGFAVASVGASAPGLFQRVSREDWVAQAKKAKKKR